MKKLISFVGVAAIVFALSVPTAFAAEFITGDDNGNVTLSAGETHHNVYTAGGTVFVNSTVNGDIYAAGGTVTIESNIEQDAVIGAGTVSINGEINGDLRVGSGTVTINNRVAGDVLIGGGTVVLTEKASVGGDLIVGGGTLTVNGPVSGNAKIGVDTVTLNSAIDGKVEVQAGQSLVIGSRAVILQTISYKGVKEAVVQDGAQVSAIEFEKINQHHNNHAGRILASIFTLVFVIKIVALILAGFLLMKLFPRTSRESVEYMQRGMWMNLLIGFIALVIVPVAIVVLLITFVGMYIGFAVILVWLLMLLLAALVTVVFAGAWLIKLLTTKTGMAYDWQALIIGTVAIALLVLVPFVGGLVFFILLLMAFGGLIRQLYDRVKTEQIKPQETLI